MLIWMRSISQLLARRPLGRAPAPGTALRGPATRPDNCSAATLPAPQSLEQLVMRRVAGIAATDPDRRNKVQRAFLESVVLFKVGSQLINDPGFYTLVDDIQVAMAQDPETSAQMETLTNYLLSKG
jgi:hypothetical protein